MMTDKVGDAKAYAEPVAAGVSFAVKELNAKGGILGKTIELLVEDDQAKPDVSATLARKLVDAGAAFILLVSLTPATQQAQSVTKDSRTPHMTPSNSGDTLTTASWAIRRRSITTRSAQPGFQPCGPGCRSGRPTRTRTAKKAQRVDRRPCWPSSTAPTTRCRNRIRDAFMTPQVARTRPCCASRAPATTSPGFRNYWHWRPALHQLDGAQATAGVSARELIQRASIHLCPDIPAASVRQAPDCQSSTTAPRARSPGRRDRHC